MRAVSRIMRTNMKTKYTTNIHGILQKAPMNPNRPTNKTTTPMVMTGHCKNLTHSLDGLVDNHIPVPIMGIDSSIATKFIAAVKLVLAIFSASQFTTFTNPHLYYFLDL